MGLGYQLEFSRCQNCHWLLSMVVYYWQYRMIMCSISSSSVKVLNLIKCKLSDDILPILLKLFANLEELDLGFNDFTTAPECTKECHFLIKLVFSSCLYLQEITQITPGIKYFNVELCRLLSSSSRRSVLLNQELVSFKAKLFLIYL